jgi:hypothetical protein
MALKNYNFPFTAQGFTDLQADIDARFDVIEKLTGITKEQMAAAAAEEYTGGTFSYQAVNYTFTKAAFFLPGFGYRVSNAIAADPTGENAQILDDLIARESPVLEVVP